MMAKYMYGNVAVQQAPMQKPEPYKKQVKSAVQRRKGLTMQEKLLYLLTIIVCVVVASLILSRYAQIYEINMKIQQIEQNIQVIEIENHQLRLEVSKLQDPKRIMDKALEFGMLPASDQQITDITFRPDHVAVASVND